MRFSASLLTRPETSVSLHPKMATESKDCSRCLKRLPWSSTSIHTISINQYHTSIFAIQYNTYNQYHTSTFAHDIQDGF